MAPQPHQEPDPLDVLQNMVNDVLVHTGKALRASRKDAQGSTQSTQSTLKSKLPESIDGFREALHKLEWDIIDAKSVLMRDVKRLQEQKQQQIQQSQPTPVSQPQPVEPQSKSPMVIDLESSPPPPPQDQHMTEIKTNKPVAPFPDMGMGLPDIGQPISVPNDETISSVIPSTRPEQTNSKTISPAAPTSAPAATAPMAPMPIMEHKAVDNQNNNVTDLTGDGPHSELNFTNMQFTLALTNNDSQNTSNSQEPAFDLATFAPPEGNDDILGLDDILPTNNASQTNGISQLPAGSADNVSKRDLPMDTDNLGASQEMSNNNYDSVFDDEIFGGLGTGDGLADGTDDITFESLMNDRDDDNLNYGEFDDTFLLESI
ncbi:uncharacterized protein FSUBG_13524 [Fusarium subglutinans]|uniref:Uncharacterized protein n=1 Tax=Gibberella subglutinans TaxID=42677 RepID=A0A8H5NUL9_GIBSU|nr:uncharacterized protein FSUBG_13524 [Fusarium subglutinans]KAF5579891.1 hypothetical protein FSUBG_13524 [Fusarium subglutinans]